MKSNLRKLAFIITAVLMLQIPSIVHSETASATGGTGGNSPEDITAIAASGSYIYTAAGSSITVFEASGGQMLRKGKALTLSAPVLDLEADGNTLLAAAGAAGLQVIDISDPQSPALKGSYRTEDHMSAVAAYGTKAYTAGSFGGIRMVDISDTGMPVELQAFQTKYPVNKVSVSDIFACMSAGIRDISISYTGMTGLEAYAGSVSAQGNISDFSVCGNYLYVADETSGISAYEIDISGAVRLVSSFGLSGARIKSLAACCGKLYCLNESGSILCFDVSNPAGIKLTNTFNTFANTSVEAYKGNKASNRKGNKIAYITIDDGPSRRNTPVNLDTLKKYGVKATFFVLPKEKVDDIYKRILDEGHVIGNHSFSHDYLKLYSDVNDFKKDVQQADNFLRNKLNYSPVLFRFPGGAMSRSKNVVNDRIKVLSELGYTYFDWNSSTGDAVSHIERYGSEQQIVNLLTNNVIKKTGGRKRLIVLMHDAPDKIYSVKALPKIIEGLMEQGYTFDVLTNYNKG